jgi:Tfp pilus assembly protein FimT
LELLIVITILALVTATTIPLMLSGVDQRRAREAARLVSGYIASAKSRAIETGRSAGVLIQRSASGIVAGGSSINLYMVECPQLYAGDTLSSLAVVTVSGSLSQVVFNGGMDNIAANVHVGDTIRFGYQGRTYVLMGSATSISSPPLTAGQALPVNGSNPYSNLWATDNSQAVAPQMSNGVTYQVFRQPTKSAVPGLQLPEGAVIDLVQSGFGLPPIPAPAQPAASPGYLIVDGNPIVITFGPSGTVDQVFYYGQMQGHLASPLCLLIGKPDQVANTPGNDANAIDGTSLWVAVTPQGRVISVENAINAAAATFAGNRAFIFGYGFGAGGTGGITTSAGGG